MEKHKKEKAHGKDAALSDSGSRTMKKKLTVPKATDTVSAVRKKPSSPKKQPLKGARAETKKKGTRRLNVSLAPGVRKLLQNHLTAVRATSKDRPISRNDVINEALRQFLPNE
jgi:hypothetical protein